MIIFIPCFPVTNFQLNTLPEENFMQFWYTLVGHTHFTFKVKATKNVKVILANIPTLHHVLGYLVTIGDDDGQMTKISKRDGSTIDESTPDILDPEEGSEFWVSWYGGIVRVGTGIEVGENELVHFDDGYPIDINAVSISTDQDVTGKWEINFSGGEL